MGENKERERAEWQQQGAFSIFRFHFLFRFDCLGVCLLVLGVFVCESRCSNQERNGGGGNRARRRRKKRVFRFSVTLVFVFLSVNQTRVGFSPTRRRRAERTVTLAFHPRPPRARARARRRASYGPRRPHFFFFDFLSPPAPASSGPPWRAPTVSVCACANQGATPARNARRDPKPDTIPPLPLSSQLQPRPATRPSPPCCSLTTRTA